MLSSDLQVCFPVATWVQRLKSDIDVSTSFKRLQAEKLAADRILREYTSVESVSEVDSLRDFLQNMNFKAEVMMAFSVGCVDHD